ncbi:helix-turn-helix domain-containing protein [Demequina phytophila]|uniref:helix-turn-helix domain-containing protein n=1 Tax=Demequina phytophila TaxID=1638981 RepID=UPI00078662FA|nr:helix-turn-helix domain-containing protein [Demequina phytophila]
MDNISPLPARRDLADTHLAPTLTIEDVKCRLRLSKRKIYDMVRDGDLQAYRIKNVRGLRFKLEDVDAQLVPIRAAA